MIWFYFILSLLAAWRVTHLLQAEDGPFDIIFRLRKMLGNTVFGKMMDCFNCLSLWVAMPLGYYLGESWLERILIWLAISGGTILLERQTGRNKNKSGFMQEYKED